MKRLYVNELRFMSIINYLPSVAGTGEFRKNKMSRILFAWELGANYGHLSRQLPIAQQLRRQGHDVFFVVRDTTVAAQLLGPYGFAFTQAPFDTAGKRSVQPPANYAEILLASGYADRAVLWGLVRSWLSLIEMFKADIIIVDHAPTALFAAHLTGLPTILIGNGFEIPPDCSPLPSIRPWEAIANDRLLRAEEFVLERLNTIASSLSAHTLQRIPELFQGTGKILSTFAELDHYGIRDGEIYAGPIFSSATGQQMTWSELDKPHIFAYLRPSVPGFELLLKALSKQPAEVIVVAPGIRRAQAEAVVSVSFRVLGQPVLLDSLLELADLVVSTGGTGTVSQCLLAGVPLLLVPQNVEQYLMSQCIEALGAGLTAKQKRQEEDFAGLLERLLHDPCYRKAADVFAKQYVAFTPEQAVDQAVQLINTVLAKSMQP